MMGRSMPSVSSSVMVDRIYAGGPDRTPASARPSRGACSSVGGAGLARLLGGRSHQPFEHRQIWTLVADVTDHSAGGQAQPALLAISHQHSNHDPRVRGSILYRIKLVHLPRTFVEYERRYMVEKRR